MSRDMAVINKIKFIEPIPNKDRIVLYGFEENDWKIIDQKDKYNIGDLVVRIEVDSLLPVRPEFEFLRSKCYIPKFDRFRVKAMKMAGVISQGLLLGLDILPKGKYKSGQDVSSILNVLKYEDAEDASPTKSDVSLVYKFAKVLMNIKFTRPLGRKILSFINKNKISSNFPTEYISKTDETILQNFKGLLEKWAETECYITLKCEGKSSTYLYNIKNGKPKTFLVCSRNLAYSKAESGSTEFWQMNEKYSIKDKILKYYNDKCRS